VQAPGKQTHGWDEAAVHAAVTPVLRSHGVELVEMTFKTEQGGWVLRVTVEPPWDPEQADPSSDPKAAGLTLEVLADVSRDLSAALDVVDAIGPRYNLEVSSPGLDRPLKSPRDFRRFVGRAVKVHLTRPSPDGQRVLRGRLVEATDDAVTVEVDGKPISASLADVGRAHLVYELSSQPKPGRGSAPKKKGERSHGPGAPSQPSRTRK
jgi:ribosome maturation factor RimP